MQVLQKIHAQQQLAADEIRMPTPGLQDSEDDFVIVSAPQYIDLDIADDIADGIWSSKADDYISEEADADELARDIQRSHAMNQHAAAVDWNAATTSMLDAQKALQHAEESYKKLQDALEHQFEQMKLT